ncbi:hypothetical protein PP175_05740 [Aneurinibacillus sp. Ricciae_BoGa-3]|uniref:hypothetical protein n=1 Tax=Aneurinibacillus sp. Ricciae_BoGa-3 TaxID=3022697 RepID=UPI00233FB4C4|nr:hypothetical protein [Aneurinibacillus sp. Ricciae_BoGa-3]WCK55451.1 hypothetical protein PP175_05740 [Aneurinibacillus sp. Ricciae_BoGa-3]
MNGATEPTGKMLYPPEYEEFAKLVKKHVVYSLVLRVLPGDITTIGRAEPRLGKSYVSVLVGIQKLITNELVSVRKRMRTIGGKIVEEKQEEFVRVVTSQLGANTYKHRFGNYVLLHECEDTVKAYIQGNEPSLA